MKSLLVIATLVLAGCATAPPPRYAQPSDPSQWRVVSVTPVPAGTGARVAAGSPDGKAVEYSSTPVAVVPAPVAPEAPVVWGRSPYDPEPEYYWPPISLSLGFIFGRGWWGGGRAHFKGRRR
jgi:hypothetical protein